MIPGLDLGSGGYRRRVSIAAAEQAMEVAAAALAAAVEEANQPVDMWVKPDI
jgi:hypothetical protein